MQVTVASYNIHKGEGIDRRIDLARIARVLREINADVVGIQEIYRPQAETLAADLRMNMAMGVTRHFAGVPYGNAILTRPGEDSVYVVRKSRAVADSYWLADYPSIYHWLLMEHPEQ